ncbi:MAG: hypothetical protein HY698_11560 [Deltaproteobacteria bacterium]|nr:hypothetical protein [Deltaproteobacteria bacterium]
MSRILLVADPAPMRDELAVAIARGPHTVKAIAPGDLRIEAMREWEPDVVVMDLAAEGAALPLRMVMLRDSQLSQVPFVALGQSEDEARALGAHAFVKVPPPIDGLVQLLNRFAALRMPLPT